MMPCGLELSGIFLGLQHFTFLSSTLSTIVFLTTPPSLSPSFSLDGDAMSALWLRFFAAIHRNGLHGAHSFMYVSVCVWGSVCREGGEGAV